MVVPALALSCAARVCLDASSYARRYPCFGSLVLADALIGGDLFSFTRHALLEVTDRMRSCSS